MAVCGLVGGEGCGPKKDDLPNIEPPLCGAWEGCVVMGVGSGAEDSVRRSFTAEALKGDKGPGENVGVTERADEGRR